MALTVTGGKYLPPMTAKKMLMKATDAMRPKAPTENRASPEVEYSSAASIACSKQSHRLTPRCEYDRGEGPDHKAVLLSHQPAGEGVRLQCLSMSHKEHLVLRCVSPNVAEQLKESIARVSW